MIGLVISEGGGVVHQAFLEECPRGVVVKVDTPVDTALALMRAAGVVRVIPATPGAASFAFDCARAMGQPISPVPPLQGDPSTPVAPDGLHLCVDIVSLGGKHVGVGVYEHRVVTRGGQQRLRHRLSVEPAADAARTAFTFACSVLDEFEVRDGATCIEIDLSARGPHLLRFSPAPIEPGMPADAAYSAFGHSHQHLLMESLLRPREFERRFARPLTPGATTLAVAPIWNWRNDGATGRAGLRLLRRLAGFHSVTSVSWVRTDAGPAAIASFVHADRASVANSLAVLHEYVDSHAFFADDDELIGFAATAA